MKTLFMNRRGFVPLLGLVLILAVAIIAAGSIYFVSNTKEANTNENVSAAINTGNTNTNRNVNINGNLKNSSSINMNSSVSTKGEPVVIYTREISAENTQNRRWPTVEVFRKIGLSEPELLATVGKVGEYPHEFIISPDRASLIINLESKIQSLDLTTKSLTDLLTAQQQFISATFSRDGDELFLWDQEYVGGITPFIAHVLKISDLTERIVGRGTAEGPFFSTGWPTENIVTIAKAGGEMSFPWYFDLASGQLSEVSRDAMDMRSYSSDGRVFLTIDDTVVDACNDFSGMAWSTYEVRDSVTAAISGIVGIAEKATNVVAISPDHSRVLYGESPVITDRDRCTDEVIEKFYTQSTNGGQPQPVNDPTEVLRSWNSMNVMAVVNSPNSNAGEPYQISVQGQVIVTDIQQLSVAAQYYQP